MYAHVVSEQGESTAYRLKHSWAGQLGRDWLLLGLPAGMEGLCRLELSQMRPCTLACLVANECSILDHRNRVWLLVWTVLWYELVCPAVFGLAHDRRCEHPGMVLVRLPPYSIVQGRQ